jgi:hypothetical protein
MEMPLPARVDWAARSDNLVCEGRGDAERMVMDMAGSFLSVLPSLVTAASKVFSASRPTRQP